MLNAANDGGDRASDGVAAAAVRQDFATNHVLLISELKLGEGGTVKGLKGADHNVQNDVADTELDVTKTKRSGLGGDTIFARTEEVEETNVGHVGGGKAQGITGKESNTVDFMEEWKWDRFDTAGRWVKLGIAFVEIGKAVIDFAKSVQARIVLAQLGEDRGD